MLENVEKMSVVEQVKNNIDKVIEHAKANPEQLSSRVIQLIAEKGVNIFFNTLHGIMYAGLYIKELTMFGARAGMVDVQKYISLLNDFPILNHIANMAGTYTLMGITMVSADFIKGSLEGLGNEKLAKQSEKIVPILGAITLVAANVFAEMVQVFPTDTLDGWDAVLGSIMVVPGYFVYRSMMGKNREKIQDRGIMIFGRFKKELTNFEDEISVDDIEVIETKIDS